jgi:hypothetical protein
MTRAIPEIDSTTLDERKTVFDEVAGLDHPVVLRGIAGHWPLVKQAQESDAAARAFLAGFDAGTAVTAFVGPPSIGGRLHYTEGLGSTNFEQIETTLAWVLGRLEALEAEAEGNADTIYMGSSAIRHCLPGLETDNSLALGDREATVRIWLGNRTVVAAHFDVLSNIACVAAGRRRFTLIPPDQLPNLYIGPLELTPAGQQVSLVDLRNPDFEQFPRAREALAQAQVAELDPGDAIYVPSMWWHHVEALSAFNILINHWWRDTPAFVGPPGDALLHAILNVRELPRHERDAWRVFFDHYVFDARPEHVAHIPPDRRGVFGELDDDMARRLRHVLRSKLNR